MADNSPSGSSPGQPESLGQKAKSLLGVILKRPAPPPPRLDSDDPPNPSNLSPSASSDEPAETPGPSGSSSGSGEPAPAESATKAVNEGATQAHDSSDRDEYWTGLEKLKAASPTNIPGGGRR